MLVFVWVCAVEPTRRVLYSWRLLEHSSAVLKGWTASNGFQSPFCNRDNVHHALDPTAALSDVPHLPLLTSAD